MKYSVIALFCLMMVVGCNQKEDDYIFEQAYLSSSSGIDTVSVNEPASIKLKAAMPNCCGAEFVLTEISSTAVSRTIRVDGRYKGDVPGLTMPEPKEFQYVFTPAQKGNFFLNYALRSGGYAVDTFFVR
jgi:hypothetical protein